MCGIVGVVARGNVNQDIYDALTLLQHRGQDAAGMGTCDGDRLFMRKGKGLARDVFQARHMLRMLGNMGIGHVRYPTAGSDSDVEAQPFYVNSPYGIMLAHNGNLVNNQKLQYELQDLRKQHITTDDIFKAVAGVHRRCVGAYAVVAMITGFGIVGFRDVHGIRPVVYGKRETERGTEFMIASENVALDVLGFEIIGDIPPGGAVYITRDGEIHVMHCAEKASLSPCLFEYVYLARPDSVIDKISVYKVRLRLGEQLAAKIKREWPEHDIQVVMPIPDTSRTAAATLARDLEIKFREGFVKNRYIGRTFIMPGQQLRRKSVRQKLNTIPLEFRDKNVLLVDDSIVRGTTSKEIIQMARDAGANKVYFASAAPPVRYPNVYGIDMPAAEELIAHDRDTEEVCKLIGADRLIYQDLQVLVDACHEGNADITHFEDSVFTGNYITGHVDDKYLAHLAELRKDAARKKQSGSNCTNLD